MANAISANTANNTGDQSSRDPVTGAIISSPPTNAIT